MALRYVVLLATLIVTTQLCDGAPQSGIEESSCGCGSSNNLPNDNGGCEGGCCSFNCDQECRPDDTSYIDEQCCRCCNLNCGPCNCEPECTSPPPIPDCYDMTVCNCQKHYGKGYVTNCDCRKLDTNERVNTTVCRIADESYQGGAGLKDCSYNNVCSGTHDCDCSVYPYSWPPTCSCKNNTDKYYCRCEDVTPLSCRREYCGDNTVASSRCYCCKRCLGCSYCNDVCCPDEYCQNTCPWCGCCCSDYCDCTVETVPVQDDCKDAVVCDCRQTACGKYICDCSDTAGQPIDTNMCSNEDFTGCSAVIDPCYSSHLCNCLESNGECQCTRNGEIYGFTCTTYDTTNKNCTELFCGDKAQATSRTICCSDCLECCGYCDEECCYNDNCEYTCHECPPCCSTLCDCTKLEVCPPPDCKYPIKCDCYQSANSNITTCRCIDSNGQPQKTNVCTDETCSGYYTYDDSCNSDFTCTCCDGSCTCAPNEGLYEFTCYTTSTTNPNCTERNCGDGAVSSYTTYCCSECLECCGCCDEECCYNDKCEYTCLGCPPCCSELCDCTKPDVSPPCDCKYPIKCDCYQSASSSDTTCRCVDSNGQPQKTNVCTDLTCSGFETFDDSCQSTHTCTCCDGSCTCSPNDYLFDYTCYTTNTTNCNCTTRNCGDLAESSYTTYCCSNCIDCSCCDVDDCCPFDQCGYNCLECPGCCSQFCDCSQPYYPNLVACDNAVRCFCQYNATDGTDSSQCYCVDSYGNSQRTEICYEDDFNGCVTVFNPVNYNNTCFCQNNTGECLCENVYNYPLTCTYINTTNPNCTRRNCGNRAILTAENYCCLDCIDCSMYGCGYECYPNEVCDDMCSYCTKPCCYELCDCTESPTCLPGNCSLPIKCDCETGHSAPGGCSCTDISTGQDLDTSSCTYYPSQNKTLCTYTNTTCHNDYCLCKNREEEGCDGTVYTTWKCDCVVKSYNVDYTCDQCFDTSNKNCTYQYCGDDAKSSSTCYCCADCIPCEQACYDGCCDREIYDKVCPGCGLICPACDCTPNPACPPTDCSNPIECRCRSNSASHNGTGCDCYTYTNQEPVPTRSCQTPAGSTSLQCWDNEVADLNRYVCNCVYALQEDGTYTWSCHCKDRTGDTVYNCGYCVDTTNENCKSRYCGDDVEATSSSFCCSSPNCVPCEYCCNEAYCNHTCCSRTCSTCPRCALPFERLMGEASQPVGYEEQTCQQSNYIAYMGCACDYVTDGGVCSCGDLARSQEVQTETCYYSTATGQMECTSNNAAPSYTTTCRCERGPTCPDFKCYCEDASNTVSYDCNQWIDTTEMNAEEQYRDLTRRTTSSYCEGTLNCSPCEGCEQDCCLDEFCQQNCWFCPVCCSQLCNCEPIYPTPPFVCDNQITCKCSTFRDNLEGLEITDCQCTNGNNEPVTVCYGLDANSQYVSCQLEDVSRGRCTCYPDADEGIYKCACYSQCDPTPQQCYCSDATNPYCTDRYCGSTVNNSICYCCTPLPEPTEPTCTSNYICYFKENGDYECTYNSGCSSIPVNTCIDRSGDNEVCECNFCPGDTSSQSCTFGKTCDGEWVGHCQDGNNWYPCTCSEEVSCSCTNGIKCVCCENPPSPSQNSLYCNCYVCPSTGQRLCSCIHSDGKTSVSNCYDQPSCDPNQPDMLYCTVIRDCHSENVICYEGQNDTRHCINCHSNVKFDCGRTYCPENPNYYTMYCEENTKPDWPYCPGTDGYLGYPVCPTDSGAIVYPDYPVDASNYGATPPNDNAAVDASVPQGPTQAVNPAPASDSVVDAAGSQVIAQTANPAAVSGTDVVTAASEGPTTSADSAPEQGTDVVTVASASPTTSADSAPGQDGVCEGEQPPTLPGETKPASAPTPYTEAAPISTPSPNVDLTSEPTETPEVEQISSASGGACEGGQPPTLPGETKPPSGTDVVTATSAGPTTSADSAPGQDINDDAAASLPTAQSDIPATTPGTAASEIPTPSAVSEPGQDGVCEGGQPPTLPGETKPPPGTGDANLSGIDTDESDDTDEEDDDEDEDCLSTDSDQEGEGSGGECQDKPPKKKGKKKKEKTSFVEFGSR